MEQCCKTCTHWGHDGGHNAPRICTRLSLIGPHYRTIHIPNGTSVVHPHTPRDFCCKCWTKVTVTYTVKLTPEAQDCAVRIDMVTPEETLHLGRLNPDCYSLKEIITILENAAKGSYQ